MEDNLERKNSAGKRNGKTFRHDGSKRNGPSKRQRLARAEKRDRRNSRRERFLEDEEEF